MAGGLVLHVPSHFVNWGRRCVRIVVDTSLKKKKGIFMRRTLLLMLVAVLVLLMAVPVQAGGNRNFAAPLDGGQENPPVATNATGLAKFKLSKDDSSLEFKLIVANIDNVFAAHIHCEAVGVNGPVGVTLFFAPPPNLGSVNGVLAQGTITAPDTGNDCGWSNLAAVAAALRSGDTYVNVHTLPGTPSGEIRGQIE